MSALDVDPLPKLHRPVPSAAWRADAIPHPFQASLFHAAPFQAAPFHAALP